MFEVEHYVNLKKTAGLCFIFIKAHVNTVNCDVLPILTTLLKLIFILHWHELEQIAAYKVGINPKILVKFGNRMAVNADVMVYRLLYVQVVGNGLKHKFKMCKTCRKLSSMFY